MNRKVKLEEQIKPEWFLLLLFKIHLTKKITKNTLLSNSYSADLIVLTLVISAFINCTIRVLFMCSVNL